MPSAIEVFTWEPISYRLFIIINWVANPPLHRQFHFRGFSHEEFNHRNNRKFNHRVSYGVINAGLSMVSAFDGWVYHGRNIEVKIGVNYGSQIESMIRVFYVVSGKE